MEINMNFIEMPAGAGKLGAYKAISTFYTKQKREAEASQTTGRVVDQRPATAVQTSIPIPATTLPQAATSLLTTGPVRNQRAVAKARNSRQSTDGRPSKYRLHATPVSTTPNLSIPTTTLARAVSPPCSSDNLGFASQQFVATSLRSTNNAVVALPVQSTHSQSYPDTLLPPRGHNVVPHSEVRAAATSYREYHPESYSSATTYAASNDDHVHTNGRQYPELRGGDIEASGQPQQFLASDDTSTAFHYNHGYKGYASIEAAAADYRELFKASDASAAAQYTSDNNGCPSYEELAAGAAIASRYREGYPPSAFWADIVTFEQRTSGHPARQAPSSVSDSKWKSFCESYGEEIYDPNSEVHRKALFEAPLLSEGSFLFQS